MATLRREVRDGQGNLLVLTKQLTLDLTPPVSPITGGDWNTSANPPPTYYTGARPTERCYRLGHAATAAGQGADHIALTDESVINLNNPSAAATTFRNWAEDFWYGAGSAARKDKRVTIACANEIDSQYTSGQLPAVVIDTHDVVNQVAMTKNGDGSRRFPNLETAVDMTWWQVHQFGAGLRFKPLAPFVTRFACSLYNPGRDKTPVVWTPYADYVDEMVATAKDWGLKFFQVWETGSAVSATDPLKRASYFGDWLNYVTQECVDNGIVPEFYHYWNRVKSGGPENPFSFDRQVAPNDTATIWYNWSFQG